MITRDMSQSGVSVGKDMSHGGVSVRAMSHRCERYESEWSKCGKRKESM